MPRSLVRRLTLVALLAALQETTPAASRSADDSRLSPFTVQGTVLDDATKPLHGADVLLWTCQGIAHVKERATTDLQGRFAVASRTPYVQIWNLEVKAAGFAPAKWAVDNLHGRLSAIDVGAIVVGKDIYRAREVPTASGVASAPSHSAESRPVVFTSGTPIFRLRARRDGGGPPPEIASVRYSPARRLDAPFANAGMGRGNRCTEVIAPHEWRIQFQRVHQGLSLVVSVFATDASWTEVPVTIPPEPSTEPTIDARFPALGSVSGRVVRAGGSAVGGARVELRDRREWSPKVALCDSEGAFRFESIHPEPLALMCRSEEWVSASVDVEFAAGQDLRDLELRAVPASRLEGRLTIGGAAPGIPRSLAVYRVDGTWKPLAPYAPRGVNARELLAIGACDASGRYRLVGLPAGRVALVPADPPGNGGYRMPYPNLDNAGKPRDAEWPWIADLTAGSTTTVDVDVPQGR